MESYYLYDTGGGAVALVINGLDSVATTLRRIETGETLHFPNGPVLRTVQAVPFAHKVAIKPHADGDFAFKYGLPIGRCTTSIAAGELVHTHNLTTVQKHPEELLRAIPPVQTRDPDREKVRLNLTQTSESWPLMGYRRQDGRFGIRNHIAVVYIGESVRGIAEAIARGSHQAHVFGYRGIRHSDRVYRTLLGLATHPNVGGCVIVSLGREEMSVNDFVQAIRQTGRPVEQVIVRQAGGTRGAVALGQQLLSQIVVLINETPRVQFSIKDLIVGVECGGSDATSGIAANPACGLAVDQLIDLGGTVLFLEVNELLGCQPYLMKRATDLDVRDKVLTSIERARVQAVMAGHFAFAAGNAEGGLTTIEEKSLGALFKGGSRQIDGVLPPLTRPPGPGLYFIDFTQVEGKEVFSYYEENDPEGVGAMLASGAHMVLFTTGRGSVTGSVVGPVVKICGNPETYARMSDHFDANAGTVMTGEKSLEAVGREIFECIVHTASGRETAAERLGHREYWVPYKA